MSKQSLIAAVLTCLSLCSMLIAADKDKTAKENGKNNRKDELTLEKLFPEKSFFGPSADSTAFSFDGKYAGYLYRPREERRHGPDLWIYDVEKGKARRITSVSVMARFQESTRKVREDRIRKAEEADKKSRQEKKKAGKKRTNGDSDSKQSRRKGKKRNSAKMKKQGDWVSDEDADDEKAPRYRGIESFTWSPEANELLFVSQGDVYQYAVAKGKLTRLTRTREDEKNLAWLPDASGYTFMRGDDLMKVAFRSHLSEQLYVKLPDGERMTQYKISPDGRRMVFLTVKEGPDPGGREKTVNIAQYRDRFMKVKEVPRGVSDDPIREKETVVYSCELNQLMEENSALAEIYRYTLSQPRDFVKLPEWSADSERAVFAVYDQVTGITNIMETTWPEEPDELEGKDAAETTRKDNGADEEDGKTEDKKDDADKDVKMDEAIEKRPAKVIHRFLHTGGPTTPRMIRPYYLADNHRIVYLSEKSGFRQLHVLDPLYESDVQLTQGHFEVYPLDITKDHKCIFATATKEHPARLDVYRISLEDGTMTRLSQEDGFHSDVAVSPDGTRVLANFARFGAPRELVFIDAESNEQEQLTDSHPSVAHEMTKPRPEFFSYENRQGQEIHGFMFEPNDPNESKQRPMLVYIYGGPLGTSKSVVDGYFHSSAYFFAYYMAQKHGYVTCTIDPRGNSGYGGLFEKANFEQVGKPQVEDIVDGVKYFIENHKVDPNRVAIHGWSFGGFQTQMCLYTEPDVFAAGIAGAGPTEWENYNSWYTSGTIGISEPGSAELKKFSLLPLAKGLKAKLLLVHGMEDSNVLYQDTVRMYRELIKAGKETLVELFLDPTGGHGLGGDVKNLSRYRKYEDFLLRTVGSGKETN